MADLAKIKLTQEEEKLYAAQLGRILQYFSIMDKVKIRAGSPWSYMHHPTDAMRTDKARPSEPEPILKLAPRLKGRYIRAPRM
jgi:aspartyl/glutamyl-tRNA(Asn/Gln) amidotransferase C subunit